jgi:hypothetical protein
MDLVSLASVLLTLLLSRDGRKQAKDVQRNLDCPR